MPEFTGLTDDEKDRLRDWWDEETTVGVESVFPEVARIVKTREAAARREALLEAADDFAHLLHPYEGGVSTWLAARAEEQA